jgi:uncharacterized protein YegL
MRIGHIVLAALVSAISVSSSLAGDGTIVGNKLNLSVSFTYEESDPDSWRSLFEESSRLLYNATNGQLQLGTVRVAKCAYDKPRADIWVLDGFGGAFANPLALDGEGHIYLSQVHKSTGGGAFGQFGLVHELGHYVFGMYDEYKGEIGPGGFPAEQTDLRVPNQFCTTDLDPVACLMDGGTTVAPNNERTEFCTSSIEGLSTAHNTATEVDGVTYVNWQQSLNGESCWETIMRTIGLAAPTTVETSDPPDLEPIVWESLDDVNRIVVAIDRSGSMEGENIELAREAARQLIDLLHVRRTITDDDGSTMTKEGESISIVSFAGLARVDFDLQEMIDEAAREAAKASLDDITAWGPTNLRQALARSLDELASTSPIAACSEAIILLTDGRHTFGFDPYAVIPDLVERGVSVYSVALGSDVDLELLEEASDETGGLLFMATEAEELPGIFTQISAAVRAGGTLAELDGELTSESREIDVLVDRFSEEITAILAWTGPSLEMTLTDPDGEVIDLASAETRPDVEAFARDGFLYIRVANPTEGLWRVLIVPSESVPDPIPFDLTILGEGRLIDVRASVDPQLIQTYQPTRLRVDVVAGVPVAGADVRAVVRRPRGVDIDLPLFDDGDPAHGDQFAGDGVYQALFTQYTVNGVYTFDVTVENEDGTGPDPDLPFVEDGGDTTPIEIPPFQRTIEVSVLVDNFFEWQTAQAAMTPRTLDAGTPGENVTCKLTLESGSVENIDLSTLRLQDRVAPVSVVFVDDLKPALVATFDREAVIDVMGLGVNTPVEITGMFTSGELFRGSELMSVLEPTGVVELDESVVVLDSDVTISWPPHAEPDANYDGFVSFDGGETWSPVFTGITGSTTDWHVSGEPTTDAAFLVVARNAERLLQMSLSDPFEIVSSTVTVPDVPTRTEFLGAAPNPMFGATVLTFSLAERARVKLSIFDVGGRLVHRVADATMPAGTHHLRWDGRDDTGARASSGVYHYAFEADGYARTGRLLLIR